MAFKWNVDSESRNTVRIISENGEDVGNVGKIEIEFIARAVTRPRPTIDLRKLLRLKHNQDQE